MTDNFEIINFHSIDDIRGKLIAIEGESSIPFEIKRVYYIYDVEENVERGGHAHKDLHQTLIAISGSFTVNLDTGQNKSSIFLSRPDEALWLKPNTWRTMSNFSAGAVCLVLASEHYLEEDYIRNYQEFLEFVNH